MATHDEIVETLEKLFRLGEHPTTNPHEAANALALAQAMLLKHNLTREQVVLDHAPAQPQGIGKVDVKNESGHTWKVRLLNVLARTNLCQVINLGREKTASLFGTRDNTLAVSKMFVWVAGELEWQAMKGFRAYKNDEGTEPSRTWKAAFFDGAIIAIRDRLQPPVDAFAQGTGREIVLANTTRLQEAVAKVYPYISRGRHTLHTGSDGYDAGKQAGRTVRFGPQAALPGSRALPAGR